MPTAPPMHRPTGQAQLTGRRAYDRERDAIRASRAWYKSRRWKALRLVQLQTWPLCQFCLDDGVTTVATVCDHVTPHRDNEARFWAGPFQSLCQTCHSSRKQIVERG